MLQHVPIAGAPGVVAVAHSGELDVPTTERQAALGQSRLLKPVVRCPVWAAVGVIVPTERGVDALEPQRELYALVVELHLGGRQRLRLAPVQPAHREVTQVLTRVVSVVGVGQEKWAVHVRASYEDE